MLTDISQLQLKKKKLKMFRRNDLKNIKEWKDACNSRKFRFIIMI